MLVKVLSVFGGSQSVVALAIATVGAVGLAGFVVTSASRAAWSTTTENSGNSLTAGEMVLTDDDSSSVMFNVSGMKPGDSQSKCIVITYDGTSTITDPAAVKMYGGFTDSGNFGDYLDVAVGYGTGGSFANCAAYSQTSGLFTNTLTSFGGTHTNYSNGLSIWNPSSAGEAKTVKVTITLNASTPSAEQGESVSSLLFTWEVQDQ